MAPPQPAPTASTRTCDFWLEGPLLVARFHQGAEVELADARENIETGARLGGGRRLAVMVDLRPVKSQSSEARACFAGPEALRMSYVVALVTGSPLSQVLGNFYLRFNRPSAPTRLFSSEEVARRWLLEVVAAGIPGSNAAL